MTNEIPRWTVPIARWAVWDTSIPEHDSPSNEELHFVDPMLRRRLSRLSKMALKVAHSCSYDIPTVHFVYASRHGELTRTTAMLNDLAADEDLSPTSFSMSVLNATPGLYSILRNDRAPATAISASAESFGYGLLEAFLQLSATPEQPVLLVYADEPAPSVYGDIEPPDGDAHAIALLLQTDAPTSIACTTLHSTQPASRDPQSRAFLRCLEGATTSTWQGTANAWTWSRRAN